MARDDTTDIVAAFLIGAALGVGALLLLRDEDRRDISRLIGKVQRRPQSKPAQVLSAARDTGQDLVRVGRRTAATLRDDAAEIVAAARDEIRSAARDGIRRVRRARRG